MPASHCMHVCMMFPSLAIELFLFSSLASPSFPWFFVAFGLLESGLNFGPVLDEWQKAAAKELDFRYELSHQLRAYQAVEVFSKHVQTRPGAEAVATVCAPRQGMSACPSCQTASDPDKSRPRNHSLSRNSTSPTRERPTYLHS